MTNKIINSCKAFFIAGAIFGIYKNSTLIQAQESEELITVRKADYYFYEAADNNIYGLRPFKDHFYAKWLEAWQHVELSQRLQASLNMCVAEANGERPCLDAGDFVGDGALWKPHGDPDASCKTTAVFLLPSSYKDKVATTAEILDSNFNVIDSARFKGNTNPNRPTFCTTRFGEKYLPGPIYARYTYNGIKECRIVHTPQNRIE